MQTPMDIESGPVDSARAARFGLYPSCRAIARTRLRVSSLTRPRLCIARSTVPSDTLANLAISRSPMLFIGCLVGGNVPAHCTSGPFANHDSPRPDHEEKCGQGPLAELVSNETRFHK